jgi:HEPN domain-containing protein
LTQKETMEFARANQKAMLLLHTAAQDYAAARCLLINGLFSGLPSGAQAIEKLLKAIILFAEPGKSINNTHNLPALFGQAERLLPKLGTLAFLPIADEFYGYYQMRYPDNPNRPSHASTGKFRDLDTMVIGLNFNLPCPRNVKMRSGLFAELTHSLNHLNDVSRAERWIKQDNLALAPHWMNIEHDYFETMRELYPDNPELHHR